MPAVKAVCKGSLALGSHCGSCDRCIDEATAAVKRLRSLAFASMPDEDKLLLTETCNILIATGGHRGLMAAVREDRC